MDKLVKHLRREAAANPKKAAILGLLLLVAVWFWVPLVWGWIRPGSTGEEQASSAVESPVSAGKSETPSSPSTAPDVRRGISHTWKQVREWIESDTRMIGGASLPERRHPFDPVAPPLEEKSTSEAASPGELSPEQLATVQLDPEKLGLVLSSTIVGASGGAALINGRSYQLGNTVEADYHGQPIAFTLVEIHDDKVILSRGKQTYEIRLPERGSSGRMEVTVLGGD